MQKLSINLTKEANLFSNEDGVSQALNVFGGKVLANVEIILGPEQLPTRAFWESFLSFKRCRLERLNSLNLVGFNDDALERLALTLHDVRLEPRRILLNGTELA